MRSLPVCLPRLKSISATKMTLPNRNSAASLNHCLRPYDPREATDVPTAAILANRTERQIRNWCKQLWIGRRALAGRRWEISTIALQMVLDNDGAALRAYLAGERQHELVASYYRRLGLGHLLREWGSVEVAGDRS